MSPQLVMVTVFVLAGSMTLFFTVTLFGWIIDKIKNG